VVVVIGSLLLLLYLWARRKSELADVDMTMLPVIVILAKQYTLYCFDEWSYRFFEAIVFCFLQLRLVVATDVTIETTR
jgi:hypothetical protein